jgi:hypothetical protein
MTRGGRVVGGGCSQKRLARLFCCCLVCVFGVADKPHTPARMISRRDKRPSYAI